MEPNKEGYSLKSQSTKGLSTFVLTLSISLIVFSAIYYMMTTNSVSQEDYKVEVLSESKVTEEDTQQPVSENIEESTQQPISQNTDNVETAVAVEKTEVEKEEDKTIFGKLASSSPESYKGQVLAGTDPIPSDSAPEVQQTTTSNLETGVTSITAGLISSFILFISAMVFIYRNPRKLALNTFEKKITSRK